MLSALQGWQLSMCLVPDRDLPPDTYPTDLDKDTLIYFSNLQDDLPVTEGAARTRLVATNHKKKTSSMISPGLTFCLRIRNLC